MNARKITEQIWVFIWHAESQKALSLLEKYDGRDMSAELDRERRVNMSPDRFTILMAATRAATIHARPAENEARLELVKALLKAGANPNIKDQSGQDALNFACDYLDDTLVLALLEAGANPNSTTKNNQTPLLFAVIAGNAAAVKCLLAHGADPFWNNLKDRSLLDFLAERLTQSAPQSELIEKDQATALELLSFLFSPQQARFKTAAEAAQEWARVPEIFRKEYGDALISPLLRQLRHAEAVTRHPQKGHRPTP